MNLFNTASRGARLARILLRAPIAAASLGAFFAVTAVTTSQAKDLPPTEGPIAVEVQGPVEVLGAVDVLSEPKKVRFLQKISLKIESGFESGSDSVSIPDGKMLVVETVSVFGNVSAGGYAQAWLNVEPNERDLPSGDVFLPMSSGGVFAAGEIVGATVPMLLRIDPRQNSLQVNIARSPTSADAYFSVSVFGYLEDL